MNIHQQHADLVTLQRKASKNEAMDPAVRESLLKNLQRKISAAAEILNPIRGNRRKKSSVAKFAANEKLTFA